MYRIELDAVSAAIAGGTELPFGRGDAIDQVTALRALISASETGVAVPLG